jgi:ectoine hydroxylase-related dioxygenase (phytanoyl-CoA dioxygenase family)
MRPDRDAEQRIRQFGVEGYLVLDGVATNEDIADLSPFCERLFQNESARQQGMLIDYASPEGRSGEPRVLQALSPFEFEPALAETRMCRRAVQVATELLGAGARLTGAHIVRKPAKTGAETPWHQDEAYWAPQYFYDALSVWVPLQPVTATNGCMRFVPGSHLAEILPHRHIDDDPRVHGLVIEADLADASRSVVCPVPLGSVTLHHCRLVHSAGRNESDSDRTAIVFEVGCEPRPRPNERSFPWQELDSEAARQRRARGLHY